MFPFADMLDVLPLPKEIVLHIVVQYIGNNELALMYHYLKMTDTFTTLGSTCSSPWNLSKYLHNKWTVGNVVYLSAAKGERRLFNYMVNLYALSPEKIERAFVSALQHDHLDMAQHIHHFYNYAMKTTKRIHQDHGQQLTPRCQQFLDRLVKNWCGYNISINVRWTYEYYNGKYCVMRTTSEGLYVIDKRIVDDESVGTLRDSDCLVALCSKVGRNANGV